MLNPFIPWNKGKKLKQFCPKGHDTFIVGRIKTGCCRQCSREYEAKKRQKVRNGEHTVVHENGICINGHDTSICGRGKNGQCTLCYNEQKVNRHAAEKRFRDKRNKLIIDFKNKPCMDCRGWFDSCQMDFDHRPGEVKLFGVREGITQVSLEVFLKEIAKCDVVCANCHRLRTNKRLLINKQESVIITV